MKWRVLTVLLVVVVVAVCGTALTVRVSDRQGRLHQTLADSESIVRGCMAYQRKADARGKYPAKLSELIEPPFNGGPFVDFPANRVLPGNRIVDAWGNPFRYALVQNEKGDVEPYAWAEWEEEDGRITIVGAKGLVDGTVVRFGVPK